MMQTNGIRDARTDHQERGGSQHIPQIVATERETAQSIQWS